MTLFRMSNRSSNKKKHSRHSRVIIDLEAIRFNYKFMQSIAEGSRVIAVIKADAYGHGAIEVARALSGADAFAVATSMEAILLRDAGIKQKIIVFGGEFNETGMRECARYRLDPVIHQFWQIELLSKIDCGTPMDVWIKFDSGMGRLGFSNQDIKRALPQVVKVGLEGQIRFMTHLANADQTRDEKNLQQIELTRSLGLNEYEWGVANSAGILGCPQSRQDWVRTGLALYGSDPLINKSHTQKLKPAMTFKSRVLAVNWHEKGASIGYGGHYICPEKQAIAVIAAGYADGYPRNLKGGCVLVKDQRAPVVGRVSMDMITVNVTNLDVKVGDEVILWGANPLAEEIATLSKTISYELFCHAGCHGMREYINQV